MNTKVLQDKYTKIKQVPGVSTARLFLSHVSHEVTPSKKLSKTAWFVHVHNNQVKPIAHQMLIFAFSFQDSATYSCVSDLAPPATVQLVVTEGVRMQHNIFENHSHFHPQATFFAFWSSFGYFLLRPLIVQFFTFSSLLRPHEICAGELQLWPHDLPSLPSSFFPPPSFPLFLLDCLYMNPVPPCRHHSTTWSNKLFKPLLDLSTFRVGPLGMSL